MERIMRALRRNRVMRKTRGTSIATMSELVQNLATLNEYPTEAHPLFQSDGNDESDNYSRIRSYLRSIAMDVIDFEQDRFVYDEDVLSFLPWTENEIMSIQYEILTREDVKLKTCWLRCQEW